MASLDRVTKCLKEWEAYIENCIYQHVDQGNSGPLIINLRERRVGFEKYGNFDFPKECLNVEWILKDDLLELFHLVKGDVVFKRVSIVSYVITDNKERVLCPYLQVIF